MTHLLWPLHERRLPRSHDSSLLRTVVPLSKKNTVYLCLIPRFLRSLSNLMTMVQEKKFLTSGWLGQRTFVVLLFRTTIILLGLVNHPETGDSTSVLYTVSPNYLTRSFINVCSVNRSLWFRTLWRFPKDSKVPRGYIITVLPCSIWVSKSWRRDDFKILSINKHTSQNT